MVWRVVEETCQHQAYSDNLVESTQLHGVAVMQIPLKYAAKSNKQKRLNQVENRVREKKLHWKLIYYTFLFLWIVMFCEFCSSLNFFRLTFHSCLSFLYNYDDQSSRLHIFLCSSNILYELSCIYLHTCEFWLWVSWSIDTQLWLCWLHGLEWTVFLELLRLSALSADPIIV